MTASYTSVTIHSTERQKQIYDHSVVLLLPLSQVSVTTQSFFSYHSDMFSYQSVVFELPLSHIWLTTQTCLGYHQVMIELPLNMVKQQSYVKLSSFLDLKSTFLIWNKGTFKKRWHLKILKLCEVTRGKYYLTKAVGYLKVILKVGIVDICYSLGSSVIFLLY